MERYWIGIDTGGTFTDFVLKNATRGGWTYHKVPTWTEDPARGILEGIGEMLAAARVPPAAVEYVVLGTTKATNAVLEGKWARTGMITTRGFGDVLDLARQRRPHYFNLDIPKPVPPAKRADRHEVDERIGPDGTVLAALDEGALAQAIDRMREAGVESVAICFLHSYANRAHEDRALEMIHERWPQVYACTSAGVLPEVREYERFVTTAVNASLMPVMDRYLADFERGIHERGMGRRVRVMQSNGGAVGTTTVRKAPVNTFFSGPAGGIMAAIEIGRQTGCANLIGFDMGGTSTDVGLIRQGRPSMKHETAVGGLPVRMPTLDIHTIGAGGGSMAWIDAGGLLKVGPRSAGAYPGPAAYGRGGVEPTVTDANVVLGRLNPRSLLDGRMAVHPEKAHAAIENRLSAALGLDVVQAAVGIIEIANAHMTGAVRVITVEQGEDPRDYALLAFGGAGPLHAADVARAAGIRHVIVPPRPGVLSAQGLLQASQRADFGLTCIVALEAANVAAINRAFDALGERIAAWTADESAGADARTSCEWTLEMRYAGQSSDLAIPIDSPAIAAADVAAIRERFNARHAELFGYAMDERRIEVSGARVAVTLARPSEAAVVETAGSGSAGIPVEPRRVWFAGAGYVDTPVLRRERIEPGQVFDGPAIVEQMDSTTVVPPGAKVRADALGYLHITLSEAEGTV